MNPGAPLDPQDLRRRAEALLHGMQDSGDPANARRLLHELRVHQVELELQNETLRETEALAQAERSRYLELFEQAPLGYFTLDALGCLLQVNLTGWGLLGFPAGRGLGLPLASFLSGHDRGRFLDFLARARQNLPLAPCEVELPGPGPGPVRVQLQSGPGGAEGACGIMATDITLLHKALEERRHLAETLDQRVLLRTAQLERANREMETFTHMVSHEMRAPIARMEGFGRMLSDATGEDQVRRTAERIGEAARRMRAVIDGLLQLTRISLDPARMETVDLGSLTLRVLEDLRQESPARTDCVSVDVDLQVEGDPRLLGIALRNLLQNALKFTRDTPCPAVTVIARNQKERPLLVVRDNGVGFDMAWAGALFQPFTRLHPEADFPGLGLGLAMVRLVVTKHGGQVWAVSSPGEGAAFHLQFPP